MGIHNAIPEAECVGFSEIEERPIQIYNKHFKDHKPYGDITNIDVQQLPSFDLFVGGFPCQSFSIAGKRQGFKDTRGTLFFNVAQILKTKQPEWFLLENVKGLLSHEQGKTLATIDQVLTDIGYTVGWEVVNSCEFGVPQSRERIFIVGHLTSAGGRTREILPFGKGESVLNEIREKRKGSNHIASTLTKNYHRGVHGAGETYIKITPGTWRTHKDGQGFREVASGLAPTIPARAREDGSGQPVVKAVLTPDRLEKRQNGRRFKDNNEPSFTITAQDKHGVMIQKVPEFLPTPDGINNTLRTGGDSTLTAKHNYDHIYDGTTIRRLTPVECERLQGFPDGWTEFGIKDGEVVEIPDTQRYKALGNAVTTNVVEAIIRQIYNL